MTLPGDFTAALAERYTVERELGHGGMATVHLADDLKHRRKVAIKVMRPELSEAIGRDRFLREIEIAARLTHPHILPLYDSGAQGSLLYYVTPYIPGESLRARLNREKQLPVDDALRLAREILSALGYAHAQGLVHRDVKPENILLADGMALVADFGIARVMSTRASETSPTLPAALTSTGIIVGTPRYMAPEQAQGEDVDTRTDLYSLGCVLYEMLAGQPPFTSTTAAELIRQHLVTEARPVNELRPLVPAGVATAIARAMAKLPADRPPSAARFAEELAVASVAGAAAAPMMVSGGGAPPNNLPKQRTRFIGRDRELAECARILGDARLLTVTGIGGAGKTRLALRLAESLVDAFPDGIWWIDLAPLKEAEHVPMTAAAVLGASETPGTPLRETIAAHLGAHRSLIVLDNCEHLLSATASLVDTLLASCHDLKIIITSREGLGVAGERPFALQSLSVPSAAATDIRAIETADAVRLFVDRAQVVDPRFELTEQSAPVVAEICRRLDGIPLAIELAAARIKILSAEEIRSRLDDRFRLLTGGSKTALPRHQTLRATIQWSYDQLASEEQKLLRALSVFAGGWTLGAATRIAAEEADEFEVMDLLARLVDKSLVLVQKGAEGDSRYGLLETVRQFAQELLTQTGEAGTVRRRHLEEFLQLAETASAERILREEHWAPLLETEHDNLRGALEFARHVDPETHLQLSGALAWFWQARTHLLEGRDHLNSALETTSDAPARPARARALWGTAIVMTGQGDASEAVPCARRSIDMWRSIGNTNEVANGLESLGYALWVSGRDEESRDTFRECLRLQEELGDPVMINRARIGLGQLLVALGEIAEARQVAGEILAFARRRNDRRAEHYAFHYLADCALMADAYHESLDLYRESLRLAWALQDRSETCYEIQGVAMSLAGLGRSSEAVRLLGAAGAELRRVAVDQHIRFWDKLLEKFGDRARNAMDATSFGLLSDEGGRLPFTDAVREALEGRGGPGSG